jgi:hypothetical protein
LIVDESATTRIQEYWVQFRMSGAQIGSEEEDEQTSLEESPETEGPKLQLAEKKTDDHHQLMHSHRATTGVSLAMRSGNLLAQTEDLILFNGQNAVANSALFQPGGLVQRLDPNLQANVGLGLLNITSAGDITLPANQVVFVRPRIAPPPAPPAAVAPGAGPAAVAVRAPAIAADGVPYYGDNALNAIAQAFSILQGLGHYEHYALALHTVPYADLHQALPNTLIEPVEPVSHLVKAGIHGSGTLPPFTGVGGGPAGLPATLGGPGNPISQVPGSGGGNVLYTGVLVSLSGNTMDLVRGRQDNNLDHMVKFNQKDANEQYRFRLTERFCLRLKEQTAVVLLLFMDQ